MNAFALEYTQLYQVTSENEPTYDLWTIDDPHRAWTNPLSLSLRVKGYNGAPYCILLSSKKIFIVIQLCISIVSSGHNPLEEQTTAAKLFSINETLLFHSPGYGILPSDTVSQNSGRVSVMELHLSVDRSVLPFLGYAETSISVVNRHSPQRIPTNLQQPVWFGRLFCPQPWDSSSLVLSTARILWWWRCRSTRQTKRQRQGQRTSKSMAR